VLPIKDTFVFSEAVTGLLEYCIIAMQL